MEVPLGYSQGAEVSMDVIAGNSEAGRVLTQRISFQVKDPGSG
jgi:hypothetical protein